MILVGISENLDKKVAFNRVLTIYRELNKVRPTLVALEHEEGGKPYIKGANDIKISISHSGSYLVIALSNNDIGIDIQEHRNVDYEKICARYGINANNIDDFYKIFTLAEAHAKLTGTGLPSSLHSANEIEGKTYRFIKGYTLSVIGKGEVLFALQMQ